MKQDSLAVQLLSMLGEERAMGILSGDLVVVEKFPWKHIGDGLIFLNLESLSKITGPEWVCRLEQAGFRISLNSREILASEEFLPVSKVRTKVVIVKASFFGKNPKIGTILGFAGSKGFTDLQAEHACLIREKFTDLQIAEMGLGTIVVVTRPLQGKFLEVDSGSGGQWLHARYVGHDLVCGEADGFAFAWCE